MENNKLETITNLFESSEIRSVWDSEKEEYYFSVVDVISALTDSNIPKRYWTDLKRRLVEEGSQLYDNIVRLKLKAQDGKLRETDTLDTKGIFRLIVNCSFNCNFWNLFQVRKQNLLNCG